MISKILDTDLSSDLFAGEAWGLPLVVSAPSGGGKTTLCHKLVQQMSDVAFSISYTTRPPRGREQNGIDYYFVDDQKFDQMIASNAFLEWACVHGNRYGTGEVQTRAQLCHGIDMLFDIDVQGGAQIKAKIPNAVLIFIVPPNLKVLAERLRGRSSDSPAQIEKRLEAAKSEIAQANFYTHWIINADLEQAYAELKSIVIAERIRRRDKQALAARLIGAD